MFQTLDQRQRNILGEKFVELGNLVAVALIFSQLLHETMVLRALVFGFGLYTIFFVVALILMKGGSNGN